MSNDCRYCKWRTEGLQDSDGIVVAADISQEWMLPWWWDRYRRHNEYPVVFVDFGMSEEKKDWCRKRGEWVPLRLFYDVEKGDLAPQVIQTLEVEIGKDFLDCRTAWLKKPLACLLSPFKRTVWLDLDCETRGSLASYFPYADLMPHFAMAIDQIPNTLPYPLYNAGLVVFKRGVSLFETWSRKCLYESLSYRSDQEILSQMISDRKLKIPELPPHFNWSRCQKEETPPETIVYHWMGVHGKRLIRAQMTRDAL